MLSFFISIYVITLIIGSLSACVCFVRDIHKFPAEKEKYSKQKMRSMSESIKAEFDNKENKEDEKEEFIKKYDDISQEDIEKATIMNDELGTRFNLKKNTSIFSKKKVGETECK